MQLRYQALVGIGRIHEQIHVIVLFNGRDIKSLLLSIRTPLLPRRISSFTG